MTLTPLPLDIIDELHFIGPDMDNEYCRQIVEGKVEDISDPSSLQICESFPSNSFCDFFDGLGLIDPSTGKHFENDAEHISTRDAKAYIQRRQKYTPPQETQAQRNHIMNYFCKFLLHPTSSNS